LYDTATFWLIIFHCKLNRTNRTWAYSSYWKLLPLEQQNGLSIAPSYPAAGEFHLQLEVASILPMLANISCHIWRTLNDITSPLGLESESLLIVFTVGVTFLSHSTLHNSLRVSIRQEMLRSDGFAGNPYSLSC